MRDVGTRKVSLSCRAAWRPPAVAATIAAAILLGLVHSGARADKGINAGIYRDRDGGQQSWQIQRDHSLVWSEKPYAPCGVVFRSAYLKSPTAETLKKDADELDRLKSA